LSSVFILAISVQITHPHSYLPLSHISLSNPTQRLLTTTRFITGYLDTQIDLTRDRPSWFPPGKSLQPPTSLLEVRHCIVHRQMPSLGELKRAAQSALNWLWEWYWAHLEAAFGLPSTSPFHESTSSQDSGTVERLHSLLKSYVKARKSEIKAKRRSDLCTAASTAVAAYKTRFSPSPTTPPSASTQTALLGVLVQQSLILPADKKAGSSMSGAFLVWSPLLLAFAAESASFVAELVQQVIKEMNDVGRREEEREGLCEWAVYMLGSREWAVARGGQERAMRERVLGECMTELGTWNLRLADGIVGGMEDGEAELWRAILDASRSEGDGEMMVTDHTKATAGESEKKGEMEVGVVELGPGEDAMPVESAEPNEALEKIKGPREVVGLWKPKPIGWLPEGWDEDA
jgi:ribosomal biogenesis protein LAS1